MNKSKEALLKAFELGYRISYCGKILNTPYNTLEQKMLSNTGYPIFKIRLENTVRAVFWHRLQAYQKYGDELFDENLEARHLNSIKTDCSYSNILLGTHKENMQDKPCKDTLEYSLNATAKWRKHNATEVKEFYNKCKSYKQTMEKFNISSKGTLHFILNKAKYS